MSTLLTHDCPRCGIQRMTFDVLAHVHLRTEHGWQPWHELFACCRRCHQPSIFVVSLTPEGYHGHLGEKFTTRPESIMMIGGALDGYFDVEGYVSLKDASSIQPPEHLPENIEKAFSEGATCFAVGCYNAAGTMFRLCLDFASKPLLPDPTDSSKPQPSKYQRFNLGARLSWLLDNNGLPEAMRELAHCIREDANDGAHAGTLSKHDAEDILDFTVQLLERLYTEPKKLELAKHRRDQRRGGQS